MLSGIGPAEHLNSVGVKVRLDLPGVGQNLQDHMHFPFPFYTKESGMTTSPYGLINPINYLRLFFGGGGDLADNGLGTNGMIRTKALPDSLQSSRTHIFTDHSPKCFLACGQGRPKAGHPVPLSSVLLYVGLWDGLGSRLQLAQGELRCLIWWVMRTTFGCERTFIELCPLSHR